MVTCWRQQKFQKSAKISKNVTFFQKALTFDLKEIFQICFQILKDKKLIFNINSGFLMGTKNKVTIRRQKRAKIEKIFFSFFGTP